MKFLILLYTKQKSNRGTKIITSYTTGIQLVGFPYLFLKIEEKSPNLVKNALILEESALFVYASMG